MGNTTTDALRDVMAALDDVFASATSDLPKQTHAKAFVFLLENAPVLRTALSVLARYEAAPEGEVMERGLFDDHDGIVYGAPNELIGQRVRLVAAGEG